MQRAEIYQFPRSAGAVVREAPPLGDTMKDGYVRTPNAVADALMKSPLTSRESRVFQAIQRATYGWQRESAWVAASVLAKMTGMPAGHCSDALNSLLRKRVLIREGGSRSPVRINDDVSQWDFSERKARKAPSKRGGSNWGDLPQDGVTEKPQDGVANKDRKDITPKTHVASNATSGSPAKPAPYPEAFEACWKAYPKRHRHDGKKPAFKAWKARIREGIPEDTLLLAVKRYADQCDADDTAGTRFVKMAQTFFGPDEHWRPFAENRQDQDTTTTAPAEAQINLEGRAQYRPLPGCVEQPDDDGFLTFPDGSRWHVSDWDAGRVPQEAWS